MGHHHSPYNQVVLNVPALILQFYDIVFAAVQVPADPGRYSRLGCLAFATTGRSTKRIFAPFATDTQRIIPLKKGAWSVCLLH